MNRFRVEMKRYNMGAYEILSEYASIPQARDTWDEGVKILGMYRWEVRPKS
jgi:hypothetical protein